MLTVGFNPANSAYVQSLASGTAGTGSFLTASGRGSVVEIDNMLLSMWNNYRLSPTVLYVNAQEQKNITNKCLTNASGPLIHYNVAADQNQGGPYGISASGVVRWYYNPFSVDGGFDIPVKVHPDLPPGTILALCERLPVWYQSNQTPNVAEVLTRRDYYRVDWPLRTRRREYRRLCRGSARGLRAVRRRHPHQHRQRLSISRAGRPPGAAPFLSRPEQEHVEPGSHHSAAS